MSGIPVFSAGTSLQSSGASVSAQIPADSAGMLPLFVRVTATAAGYFRLSQDGASASIGDLLIQPSDGLILKTCGLSQFSFVSQSGASTVTVTPIDVGGIKYPTNIFTPAALFTTGVNGAWYDPSDFSTLFQDAAGTTPVTAVGQPVGLMLDKSKGLVLGPELVTNGDFSQGTTRWTLGNASWSVTGGKASNDGTNGVYASLAQNGVINSGKFYVVEWDQTITSGSINLWFAGTQSVASVVAGSGRKSYKVRAEVTGSLFFEASIGGVLSIDNISVRELPGNHAFNPSGNSANFPVLSARYNLLTKTEQFDDAVWAKSNVTISANAVAAPDGTLTADLISPTTTGLDRHFKQTFTSTSGFSYTQTVYAKANGIGFIYFADVNNAYNNVWFNLTTGSVSTPTVGVASITSVGNGWWRCSQTTVSTGTSGTSFIALADSSGSRTSTASGNNGVYLWGADPRVSNDALNQPAYQRVNTATDYDTAGFKPYLSFNGVNQWLQTNSIDFTATDKMFVSAGVRKLSDAAAGILTELSANRNTNNSAFTATAPASAASNYGFGSKGTNDSFQAVGTYAAPITNVVSCIGSILNDANVIRVNGTQAASSTTDQGTGNYGNYPLYIGARAGSSLWFNGRLYGLVVAGKQVSASEIASTEAWLNQKTGAY